ncbi:hypothetical protein ACQPZJ_35780 [Actinoplanes sp. CA-054009]
MAAVSVAWIDRQYDRENGGRFAEHVLASAKEFGQFLQVDAPVQLGALPPVPEGPGPAMVDLAERAVTVLTREIGELLGPMLTRLEA